jgi:sugar lactone lactonase YvrE
MAFSASRGDADTRPDSYSLPPDALYPEGIAADNKSGDFYVSSVADGSIYRGNVSSSNAELFLPGGQDGRTNATGLKLDAERLFVAGAGTGKVFIYNASSGKLIRSFGFEPAQGDDTPRPGFLNDLVINPKTGDVYITDSFVPILWRVPAEEVNNSPTPGELEPWLKLTGPPIEYEEGFNLNGIDATEDGRYLVAVQSNTGELFRIDTESKEVDEIDLGGATLTNGDGLVLKGDTLYVVRNQGLITKVSLDSLDGESPSGQVEGNTLVPLPEDFPTTSALVRGRLLVVNSQFAEGGPVPVPLVPPEDPEPETPFTVLSMPAP